MANEKAGFKPGFFIGVNLMVCSGTDLAVARRGAATRRSTRMPRDQCLGRKMMAFRRVPSTSTLWVVT